MALNADQMAAIAATRFGLGARPGEIEYGRRDPKAYLKAQIRKEGADQPGGELPDAAERLNTYRQFQQMQRAQERAGPSGQARDGRPSPEMAMQMNRQQAVGAGEEFMARTQLAITTEAAFRERWALFWANHFTVSATKAASASQAGPFEREAIRPYVFGRFEDMLLRASSHPGMLLYLDQAQSVGPNSMAAGGRPRPRANGRQRLEPQPQRQQRGLNENLAREIMELHTVSLAAAYSQADVTEFARAMTGWTVGGPQDPPDRAGKFVYRPQTHEPGSRKVMGKTYPDTGGMQAIEIMRDLAAHPATARHIATKLARHFVADEPPASLVRTLEQTFISTGGSLDKVAAALIDAPEAWEAPPTKFKTPYEFVVSSWRAVGGLPRNPQQVVNAVNQLGQRPFAAPSPKGWPDDAATWAAPDAVIKRLAWSQTFADTNAGRTPPLEVARSCLGARLSDKVAAAVLTAESRQEALTLLLMSPEFQRR